MNENFGMKPILFADFNNRDQLGRARLNCNGTIDDSASLKLVLTEGLEIRLDDHDELWADAIVEYSSGEGIWVARLISEINHKAG